MGSKSGAKLSAYDTAAARFCYAESDLGKRVIFIQRIAMKHCTIVVPEGENNLSSTGAFLLASSGLLDGKTCSTHWAAADNFRSMFPNVKLQPDKLITDENGIYMNGGAYSFLNLMVYLVEKYYDRPTAIYCSKVFQIEMDRQSQSAFIIFKGQKQHGDEMVKEAQSYIESKPSEKISVEALSSRFAIGRRNFDRRFIKATGNTPVEYLQRVKIEAAKKSFETSRKTINEVMYEVGYSDTKAFREVFRKITGMWPQEYRARYNKAAAG
jgi:transcriptional regulator GlxA family with amidase domain